MGAYQARIYPQGRDDEQDEARERVGSSGGESVGGEGGSEDGREDERFGLLYECHDESSEW